MTTEYMNDRDHRIIDALKANDTQVGGQHYKSGYQHWDFVHDFQLDYFEGCATKYVTRRKGNRKEDLRKARHFLVKRMELNILPSPRDGNHTSRRVECFCLSNRLTVREQLFLLAVISYQYSAALEQLDALIDETNF
jgi:hypothetical protein